MTKELKAGYEWIPIALLFGGFVGLLMGLILYPYVYESTLKHTLNEKENIFQPKVIATCQVFMAETGSEHNTTHIFKKCSTPNDKAFVSHLTKNLKVIAEWKEEWEAEGSSIESKYYLSQCVVN